MNRLPPGLGSTAASRSRAFRRLGLFAERVVDLLQAAEALQPQLGGSGLAAGGVLEQRAGPLGMSELPVLDVRRANEQLDAAFGRPAGLRRRRQPGRQPRRIARRLRQLPEAVFDRPILGRQGDQRRVLIERAGDVAQGMQALAALATQVAQALGPRRTGSP